MEASLANHKSVYIKIFLLERYIFFNKFDLVISNIPKTEIMQIDTEIKNNAGY